ncbi:MAG: rhomboid family intramembrane serine protease [Muribaculaceae bacterium]|nr:rhomboid family intramembrane serine protease [Muribaculaceae bacterium]
MAYNNYDPYGGNWFRRIPPVTRNLIIINLLIWVVEAISGRFGNQLLDLLGLHFLWGFSGCEFNPIQLVTYMFLHDPRSFWHVGFNMFTLYMFGRILEQTWGAKRFLIYYFVCGIGAALVQEGVWALTWRHDFIDVIVRNTGITYDNVARQLSQYPEQFETLTQQFRNNMVTMGASGAVFGLLLAFAFLFPDLPLYLFFIPVPVKAKYMVAGYAVIEFFLGVTGNMGTVAHFAHLGGMLFGLGLLLWWRKRDGGRRNPFGNFPGR